MSEHRVNIEEARACADVGEAIAARAEMGPWRFARTLQSARETIVAEVGGWFVIAIGRGAPIEANAAFIIDARERMGLLVDHVRALADEVDQWRDVAAAATRAHTEALGEVERLRVWRDRIAAVLATAQNERAGAEAVCLELRRERDELKAEVARLAARNDDLRGELESVKANSEAVQESLAVALGIISELNAEVARLRGGAK